MEKEIIKSSAIIVDATHTKARFNQQSPQEILMEKSKRLRKAVYQIDENMKDKFPPKTTTNELEDEFEFNKDAGLYVCKAGHMAIRRTRQSKKNRGGNQADTYYFDIEKCKRCLFKEGCYKEGAKSKTYLVCRFKELWPYSL